MGFGAINAKKRVSSPKSVYSKNCISDSQGRWTLGFCMEATKTPKSLYPDSFGSKARENYSGPWSTRTVENMAKKLILGHIYPWDTKAHVIWYMTKLKDP